MNTCSFWLSAFVCSHVSRVEDRQFGPERKVSVIPNGFEGVEGVLGFTLTSSSEPQDLFTILTRFLKAFHLFYWLFFLNYGCYTIFMHLPTITR